MFAPAQKILSFADGEHDGAHLGMFEPQPLHRVVQLDVDAEVVGVELELVPVDQTAVLVDIHRERRHSAVGRQLPVPVAARIGTELDAFGHTLLSTKIMT